MADAKQGKTPMEDFCNGSSQSRVVLAKPRLGGFGSSGFGSSSTSGTSKSCNPFGSVLRPPQLKPGINPFLKATEPSEDSETKTEPENSSKETKEEEVPKFVPLGSSNVTPRTANPVPAPAQPASSSSGFVFGQNLSERVVINENLNNGEASSSEHSSTNGTSELLFTSAAASVKENVQEESSRSADPAAGLAQAAAEYERSHAAPPPPTATYTTTGEEDETNVAQISCRLFAWESGSWRERGRGVLRLNDSRSGPRLLARAAGSLRLLLNTRVWPAMVADRAAPRSLRVTAADCHNQIKLFLVMGAPVDIAHLHRALQTRIALSKRASSESNSQKTEPRLEPSDDYPDSAALPQDDNTGDATSDATGDATSDAAGDATDDRLADEQKTDENLDSTEESKTLKRKEPADDETSPKRQCPEIVIE